MTPDFICLRLQNLSVYATDFIYELAQYQQLTRSMVWTMCLFVGYKKIALSEKTRIDINRPPWPIYAFNYFLTSTNNNYTIKQLSLCLVEVRIYEGAR